MSASGKTSDTSADEWLISGSDEDDASDPKSEIADGTGAERAEWHVEATPGENGDRGSIAPMKAEVGAPVAEAAEDHDLAKRVRDLQTRLRVQEEKAEAAATEADERDSEFRARIDELESKLADVKKVPRLSKKAPAVKSTRGRKSKSKDGRSDLNEITFEQLRDLGLSITQSARVIAYRDVRGGFQSLGELDEIPGLPKETRADLRKRLTLSS